MLWESHGSFREVCEPGVIPESMMMQVQFRDHRTREHLLMSQFRTNICHLD